MKHLNPVVCLLFLFMLYLPGALLAAPPSTPRVTFKVYSKTAIELFWPRSTGNSLVQGYEITRNGEVLGIFDALSYFDNTLQSGQEYTYSVRAIDANGEVSDAAQVVLRTRVPETSAEIIAQLRKQIQDLQAQLDNPVPAPIPETGQTNIVVEGDDGDWQSGVSVPEPRFIINVNSDDDDNLNGICDNNEKCNGSVTDLLTGLVWLQNAGLLWKVAFWRCHQCCQYACGQWQF